MASNHRACPLCDKQVSAPGFGKHILSFRHSEELCLLRPGDQLCPGLNKEGYSTTVKERLKERRLVPIYVKTGGTRKVYVCFGCGIARDKDDPEHFKKHSGCFDAHKARAEEFLARTVKSVDERMAEDTLRQRRIAQDFKNKWLESAEEISEMRQLLNTFLGFKREDGEDVELEDFKTFMTARDNKVWTSEMTEKEEEIATLRKELEEAKLNLELSRQEVSKLKEARPSKPTPFPPAVKNLTSSEVPVPAAAPSGPAILQSTTKKVIFKKTVAPQPFGHFWKMTLEELAAYQGRLTGDPDEERVFLQAWSAKNRPPHLEGVGGM